MEKLYMPRMQPAVREYLTRLRKEAFLEIRAGYVDSGAAPGKDTAWKDPAKLTPQTVTKEEVAMRTRRRRMLWMVPVPGTKTSVVSRSGGSQSNRPPAAPTGTAAAPGTPGATSTQQIPGSAPALTNQK
jgi:peptidyl-prolyl cis-trans isomerase SurA